MADQPLTKAKRRYLGTWDQSDYYKARREDGTEYCYSTPMGQPNGTQVEYDNLDGLPAETRRKYKACNLDSTG